MKHVVSTERCGQLNVYVQGDLSQQEKRAVFLTVHDLGCNHTSFHDFVEHPCMCEIKERSIFIHIDVPGQEDNASPLPEEFQFPTLQIMGEDLVTVLDFLHVKYVIGLGEGAGANILARFGLAHPTRILGLCLINCTGSTASVMEHMKDKFMNWKLGSSMNTSAEHYLVFHKFGHKIQPKRKLSLTNGQGSLATVPQGEAMVGSEEEQIENDPSKDKDKIIQEYQHRLRSTINSKNLKQFVNSFLNRKDLSLKNCKTDVLLVTGVNSSYSHAVEKLHSNLDKSKATLLKIEKVGDVMLEAPEKLAQSILLFCKGQGLLTSVTMPGVERQRTFSGGSTDSEGRPRFTRAMSMEEYDKPNIRRLSITRNDFLPQVPKSD